MKFQGLLFFFNKLMYNGGEESEKRGGGALKNIKSSAEFVTLYVISLSKKIHQ